VRCQRERSQSANRELAWLELVGNSRRAPATRDAVVDAREAEAPAHAAKKPRSKSADDRGEKNSRETQSAARRVREDW